jgi:hypothetical protein
MGKTHAKTYLYQYLGYGSFFAGPRGRWRTEGMADFAELFPKLRFCWESSFSLFLSLSLSLSLSLWPAPPIGTDFKFDMLNFLLQRKKRKREQAD